MLSISWALLIGLGIFLYGMTQLERGIGAISGTRLKHWLANSTSNSLASAGFGALITTILQSSSMVSLLVLAFASAGIMPLYNAIGVLIGANLGTTITGWLVATIGFKLELAKLALPLMGIGGLIQVINPNRKLAYNWGKTVFGLGMLLFGLTLMKDSVGNLPSQWDINLLQGYHPIVYLLAGLVVTALIQSSSATVMITLTALNANLIDLSAAGALVIGADLGTTGTTLIASLTGPGIKRQLALAQVSFNIIVDFSAFIILLPFLPLAVEKLGIADPIYSLVAFHSTFNLLGMLAFLPVLKPFSSWIGSFFQQTGNNLSLLAAVKPVIPEAALPVMSQSLQNIWLIAAVSTLKLMGIKHEQLKLSKDHLNLLNSSTMDIENNNEHLEIYEYIKLQEASLFQLAFELQQLQLNKQQSQLLAHMQALARTTVYASKTIKDIADDITQLKQACSNKNNLADWQLTQQKNFLCEMYGAMIPLIVEKHEASFLYEQINNLEKRNEIHAREMEAGVYQRASGDHQTEVQLSILLNVNREILHANRNFLESIRLWQDMNIDIS